MAKAIEKEKETETDTENSAPDIKIKEIEQNLPSQDNLQKLAEFYKIMGDPSRLKMLIALQKGPLTSGELAQVAGVSKSAASHQLSSLRKEKLVRSSKEGQSVIYSLDDDHIDQVLKIAFEHILEDSRDA